MTKRVVVIGEAEPGIVHITTEALHDLLTEAGWREVQSDNGDTRKYVRRDKHAARQPHENTMAGRKS